MAIRDALLAEFEHEMANTRRVPERVPGDRLAWKPHAKSYSLGALALHVASIPGWIGSVLTNDAYDMPAAVAPPSRGAPTAAAPAPAPAPAAEVPVPEILSQFDETVRKGRALIAGMEDEAWKAPWSLTRGGAVVVAMKKSSAVRTFIMNHLIHHRGQLVVYLRLNDVPVPALYGDSSDEPM